MSNRTYFRRHHHAGSWYDDDPNTLHATLDDYMHQAKPPPMGERKNGMSGNTQDMANGWEGSGLYGTPRSIIAPHAGFSYSGPTAAYAYWGLHEALEEQGSSSSRTVLVLHPSHHVYLNGCAVSGASILETPIGNLTVDDDLRNELIDTGHFSVMSRGDDEREHSGEMHYPFIAKVYHDVMKNLKESRNNSNSQRSLTLKVLPIMIGGINEKKEQQFGEILAPILARPDIFCVISSDFCHWGERFGYTPTPSTKNPPQKIHSYIQALDQVGMDHIAMQEPGAFAKYLREFKNTICGRHPISVWMHGIKNNKEKDLESVNVAFVKYAQSSAVNHSWESSVSYASAIARIEKPSITRSGNEQY